VRFSGKHVSCEIEEITQTTFLLSAVVRGRLRLKYHEPKIASIGGAALNYPFCDDSAFNQPDFRL
jgi:hypothetical protein